MRKKLMIQSLSPLALLTIVRNFSFVTKDETGAYLTSTMFWEYNKILLIVMAVCVIWILLAGWYYVMFMAFKFTDKKSGYTIEIIDEDEEASLNFFMTLIIPLLIDEVHSIQGALTLLIIIILMCVLLFKTSLFYANPVLAILGYRVYIFKFENNIKCPKDKYIGLSRSEINGQCAIEYKKITDKVFYIREI